MLNISETKKPSIVWLALLSRLSIRCRCLTSVDTCTSSQLLVWSLPNHSKPAINCHLRLNSSEPKAQRQSGTAKVLIKLAIECKVPQPLVCGVPWSGCNGSVHSQTVEQQPPTWAPSNLSLGVPESHGTSQPWIAQVDTINNNTPSSWHLQQRCVGLMQHPTV
ncbi:hypothetical protein CEXT_339641 [Caerostris extrusa]|uniref:Uncharacterized protein n=1 Tax=Caerostris extrusa TaxID=172846 RepID=A0AAV4XM89_CAEEX|nr:hypothetical protein CEXT_339641 [Caerostris extrusa]